MSLVQGYSSDEDANYDAKDAFNLNSTPALKKPRIEEEATPSSSGIVVPKVAAPHVLAEVRYCIMSS